MLKAGLIGCGYISAKHIRSMAALPDIKLVAVSDIQQKSMMQTIKTYQQLKKNHNPIAMYTNYQEMLSDSEIDFIIIAVYSGLHAPIAKQALKKGKHVMIEKPMALSLADADEIISLSKRFNKKVLVCHQLRYMPHMRKIKALIQKQGLGKINFTSVSLRLNRTDAYFSNSSWKGTWEKDGGMLVNQGIHLIDLFIWLMGDPENVYGDIAGKQHHKEIEDIASGIVTFSDHRKGLIEANTVSQPANIGYEIALFGEKGTICIGGKGLQDVLHCHCPQYPNFKDDLIRTINTNAEHVFMYQDFIQAIEQDLPPLVSAEEGRRALALVFALYDSALKKQPVSLPINEFSTKNMLGWISKGDEKND